MKIISNISPLIALSNIGELEVLRFLFGKIIIPKAVHEEYRKPLPEWMEVKEVKNKILVRLLGEKLHKGEAETIALALEENADLVIIDDKKARVEAKKLGLRIIGTAGILLLAKRRGYYKEIKPLINKLLEKGFRLSEEVVEKILKEAGES